MDMKNRPLSRLFLLIVPLLLITLACRAATRMIIPDTPTPLPSPTATQTITPSPTVPPPTPTPTFVLACPSLLDEIMTEATHEDTHTGPLFPNGNSEDDSLYGYMVEYTLKDDKLWQRDEIYIPDSFDKTLDTRSAHEWIWDFFAAVIPASERDFVTRFSALTDGHDAILGAVSRVEEDPIKWALKVDVVDADNHYSLAFTLMHEFGHLLTLKSPQVAFDKTLYYNPDNEEFYDRAAAACPQYFTQEGCSSSTSYINEFFSRYWQMIYPEWQEIDKEETETSYRNSLHGFYKLYADQFLTEYSVKSPEEDIAEAWSFFILSPKPEPNSIANEKILFFYEYPELVQLRQEILTRLCANFPE